MELEIDSDALANVAKVLRATKEECELALVRALNRVIASLKSRYGKEIASHAGMNPTQFMKYRVRYFGAKKRENPVVGFWAGLNEISLARYANRQTKSGVRTSAGGKSSFIPHAFIVPKFGKNVFLNTKWISQAPPSIQFASKQFWTMIWHKRSPGNSSTEGETQRDVGRLAYFWGNASLAENILANAELYAKERVNTEFDHELSFIVSKRKSDR